jgi:hypothetical protein
MKALQRDGRGIRIPSNIRFDGLTLIATGHGFMLPEYRNLKRVTSANKLEYRSLIHLDLL